MPQGQPGLKEVQKRGYRLAAEVLLTMFREYYPNVCAGRPTLRLDQDLVEQVCRGKCSRPLNLNCWFFSLIAESIWDCAHRARRAAAGTGRTVPTNPATIQYVGAIKDCVVFPHTNPFP